MLPGLALNMTDGHKAISKALPVDFEVLLAPACACNRRLALNEVPCKSMIPKCRDAMDGGTFRGDSPSCGGPGLVEGNIIF